MKRGKQFIGLELPLIQAPMAGVQDHGLAIAVSRAGGLGSLPCAMLEADTLVEQVSAFRAVARGPLNTNFFCHALPDPDPLAEAKWREKLQPYFSEYSIEPSHIKAGPVRRAFSHEMADVLEPLRPEVVSFHFGLPSVDLMRRIKSWGAKVISSATTLEEAKWLDARGVDAIIAQGLEAGGHRAMFLDSDITCQIGSFSLLPQIVQQVSVPVIAAGGISTPEGVAAAISLGATAVQVGTSYLLCDEATTTAIHRRAIKSNAARHTAITNIFSGRPARSIVNRAVCELGPMSTSVPQFPLAATSITAVREKAEERDSGDFSPLWCGQNASGCREISAYEMTRRLASGISR